MYDKQIACQDITLDNFSVEYDFKRRVNLKKTKKPLKYLNHLKGTFIYSKEINIFYTNHKAIENSKYLLAPFSFCKLYAFESRLLIKLFVIACFTIFEQYPFLNRSVYCTLGQKEMLKKT